MEIQKFEYLENEESFLDEIKNIFHSFWRLSFGDESKFVKKKTSKGTIYKCQNQTEMTVKMANKLTY